MKGTAKVIMGATLVMVLSLAIVLGLVLVLLAELYCSILLRRRRLKASNNSTASATNASTSQPQEQPALSPLSSFYSQGVLHAPRSFLFPKLPSKRDQTGDVEKQPRCKFHQFLNIQTRDSPPPNAPQASGRAQPGPSTGEDPHAVEVIKEGGEGNGKEQLVYISNPIYDSEMAGLNKGDGTPFETPDTSPSRLETGGSSGDEDKAKPVTVPVTGPCSPSSATTPPLTPMKELPAKASSVALKDATSLATSGSESNASSSSTGTPCTSPSW